MHRVLTTPSMHRSAVDMNALEVSVATKYSKCAMTTQLDSTANKFKRVLFVMRLTSFWFTVTLTFSGCGEGFGLEVDDAGVELWMYTGWSIVVHVTAEFADVWLLIGSSCTFACKMVTLKKRWK